MGGRIPQALHALIPRRDDPVVNPVHVAIALALSTGFIDLAVDLASGESAGVALPPIIAALAVTVGVLFFSYLAIWYAVVSRLGRSFKLDNTVLSVALALMMGVAFFSGSVQGLLTFSLSRAALAKMLIVLVACLLFSALAYFVMRAVAEKQGYSENAALLGLATPLLIGEYAIVSSAVARPMTAFLIYLVCACATLLLFSRLGRSLQVRFLVAVFCLIPVLAIVAALVPTGAAPVKQGFHLSEHKVKRVILLTIDSLRADCVSALDSRSVPTPHVDGLAGDGLVFTSVISPAPWTLPSLSSLMTGLGPEVHLAKGKNSKLPDNLQALAGYMRDSGYVTGGVVFNPYLKLSHGMSQGFLHYDVFPKTLIGNSFGARILKKMFARRFRELPTTDDLTDLAVDWLKSNKNKDSFLWVHYLDPHMPYAPPEEFLPKGKAPQGIGKRFDRSSADIRSGLSTPSQTERDWIRKLYEGEVRSVDKSVGRLLDTLKKLNIYDDSLIVLTADHGEEFWEHGSFEHGHSLYDELLRVPLIIKLPSSASKGRINTMVQTHSVMPTVLDVCGITYDRERLSVASLAPLWQGGPGSFDARPVVSSGPLYYEDKEALFTQGLKYIRYSIAGHEELYDLVQDPRERFNIANVNAGPVAEARDRLQKHHARAKQLRDHHRIEAGTKIVLDQKTLLELKSLGYVK